VVSQSPYDEVPVAMSNRTAGLSAPRGARTGAVDAPAEALSVGSFEEFSIASQAYASGRQPGAECAHLRTRRPASTGPSVIMTRSTR
jgi:hypothetical protein